MVQTVQIIRDVISIKANINFMVGLEPGDTLRLIARQINLLETCDLKGRNLELYASTFVASNDSIFLNQGEPGAPGGVGTNGAWGSKASGKRNGSDGGAGNPGGNGTNGGTVKVVAEVIGGLRVDVRGGGGGKGGQGGYGGKGDTETVSLDRPSPILVLNPSGGNGGRGGNGGNGGQGGTVTTSSATYITEPIVDVLGGRFGGKGSGGGYGGAGDVEYIPQRWPTIEPPEIDLRGEDGNDGPFGADGADGLAGSISIQIPSYAELWSALASEAFASEWAKYRHNVGEFFFRSYVPKAADRDQYIGMAVDEFQAALRLNPNQTESTFRLEQIWNDINPLGLPRKFDVIPDFKDYINGFRELSNLNATFMNIGNTLVLKSTDLQNFQDIFKSQEAQSVNRIKEATNDLEISQKNETDIQRALEETKKMIEDVKQQIDKAKEEMKKKPMTFGEIVGDVGQLAVAVSAVMAAAPTGGASLLVLAPDIISFSSTVYNSAEPLVKAILDHQETQTLTVAKDKYDKVKKDVDDISNASKKLTNLLTVIDTIKNTKTADNSKLLGLVQKGAELAYEYLLKDQELKRAQMRSRALGEKLTAEGELLKFHQAAVARTEIEDPQVVREAGLQIIKAALFRVDILLNFAFRAQRSIEIYLLKDQTQNVFYDVGRVKPDLEADYRRDSDLAVTLTSAYQESFAKLLDITAMEETYLKYFDQTLQSDTLRLSFTDPEDLSKFRSTFTLTFSLDAGTLSKERFHTKIQAVGVAFIGATGEGDLVSCRIEHGGVYSERVSSVEVESTILRARHETILASITPLEEISFGASSPPLNETQSSPLWALGIGGLYTITIPDGEFELHHPTFEGLTRIQVWFEYQFKE